MIYMISSILVFWIGLIVFQQRYGWTRSISALYDKLEEDSDASAWWFMVWQIVFSLLLVLTLQSHIITMAATFIIFSALAGDTEEHELVMKLHVIGATGAIVLGALYLIISGFWWMSVLGILFSIYAKERPMRNHTYIIEVVWFHLVCLGILI